MNDQSHPHLSVVIPAYNEESRLLSTLKTVEAYLLTQTYSSEIIIVDDGSIDRTPELAEAFAMSSETFRVLTLPHRGKAHAVRMGILASTGSVVMFTDADLSTPIAYVDHLLAALSDGAHIAIGSREGDGSRRVGEPFYRHAMGRGFNAVVRAVAVPGINDTQCGFKAFEREVARDVFTSARLYSADRSVSGPRVTGFDVEILFIAKKRGYTINEIPVEWTHIAGSKVAPIGDSVRMLMDVLRVRYNAMRGKYDTVT